MGHNGGLSAWQLTFMALGTVIGGSFFLGSAIAIRTAGPASLIAFVLGGGLVYIILSALSEMTVADPSPGSFRTHAERVFGPLAGFVVGWVYWSGLTLAMSSEAIAVAVFLRRWMPLISVPVFAALVVVGVTGLNLLGARLLATLESSLASIKLLAIIGFIAVAIVLIGGLLPGRPSIGLGALQGEPVLPKGIGGVAGSMLIVMFTYAGFEVIGLAASEAGDPHRTVPRAILLTILGLVGLYTAAVALLLPLVPTATLSEEVSPYVKALSARGLPWAAGAINVVLVTAILSTMLAAMFGLGRMTRSLAEKGHAPYWLRDRGEVPRRGILFSGTAMLAGVSLGFVLPRQVYLFLVSSGGFSLLFAYIVILATHYLFRRKKGCPPRGHCQLRGYPYTSWLGLLGLVAIIASMPLIPGQGSGLAAGLILVIFYALTYWFASKRWRSPGVKLLRGELLRGELASETRLEVGQEVGEMGEEPEQGSLELDARDRI